MLVTLRKQGNRYFDASKPQRREDCIILSPPHTGTAFLRNVLWCNYFHFDDLTPTERERVIKDKLVVVPLRDPRLVWQSYLKREGTGLEIPRSRFTNNWKRLAECHQRYDLNYVCVDLPQREEQLQSLRDKLDRPLLTNWKPINTVSGIIEDDAPMDWVYEIEPIKTFYGDRNGV